MKKVTKKKVVTVILALVLILVATVTALLVKLHIKTEGMLDDYSGIFQDEKYSEPVFVEGVEVITQDVSCGYAVIEMFSTWSGHSVTEESLYDEYGKVITSTGEAFCDEMNKQFPEFNTTIHKYMKNSELIDAVYNCLANGKPVPFEWAALYGEEWTLHYSLVTGMDIPNDKVYVANPYGYNEEISVEEFLNRTSFEAFEGMPWYFKMGFAVGMFEKNTVFIVE